MIIRKNKKYNNGFVILFAVTLASIVLVMALGVANIALEEIKFSTSAKDTNNAFFAADTGNECALVNDLGASTPFVTLGSSGVVNCGGNSISITGSGPWDFVLANIGSTGTSCAKVKVTKTTTVIGGVTYTTTTIVSKGYNIGDSSCNSTNPDRIERELVTAY